MLTSNHGKVPTLFEAKRRILFDELVRWLEPHVLKPLEQELEQLKRDFPTLRFTLKANRMPEVRQDSYHLIVECRSSDDPHTDYSILLLFINFRQTNSTSYPQVHASVAWLVDQHSDGSWGHETVYQVYHNDWQDKTSQTGACGWHPFLYPT